jgi:hypothetical protein
MAGSTEHRRAPRKSVVEIRKIGSWGNIVYHHVLECGHIEKKPRASTSPKLACAWCLRADEIEKSLTMLALPSNRSIIDDEDSASVETSIMSAQATIASRLGVNTDAVDIVLHDVNGTLEIKYATVFLSASEVRKMTGRQ